MLISGGMIEETAYAPRMRFWREYAGLSHDDLAAKCGVSVVAAKLWERDERGKNKGSPPNWDNLRRAVDAFGITLAEFWGPLPRGTRRRAS